MLTLLGAVLGFATSLAPKVIGLWEARQDRKHELAVIKCSADVQERIGAQRLEEAGIAADASETRSLHRHDAALVKGASPWVVNLAASVRPCITYLIFIEFAGLSIALIFGWLHIGQYETIWDPEMKALFAAIMSFWFGSRTLARQWHT